MSAKRFDGVGGFAKDSYGIPLMDAAFYVGFPVALVWAAVTVARWAVSN